MGEGSLATSFIEGLDMMLQLYRASAQQAGAAMHPQDPYNPPGRVS
jgi:hypothetical protein